MEESNGEAQQTNEEEELSQELTEKLLHFQEITNIDSLDRCKVILQQHAWNVESAVQSTFVERNVDVQPVPLQRQIHQSGLRRRQVGHFPPPLPIRNHARPIRFQAQRNNRPEGILGWSIYYLALPFRFTYTTLFSILRFVWRIFIPDPRARITDPAGDVRRSITEYESKFGSRHPVFFQGTYAEAQSESRKQTRFLLVYLHNPEHVNTTEFCERTLRDDDVIALVQRNCIFWICSIQSPEGYRVSRALQENTYPFLAVICQYQGRMMVLGRLEGPLTPQDFLEQVSAVIDRFEPVMIAARAERAERDMTQQLRNEQDQAYERSLLKDKEKEERKKEEEENKKRQEQENEERERRKEEKLEKYMKRKQACKLALEQEADCTESNQLRLMIKLPDGSRLSRSFLPSQPVKCIHDFIYCQDNAPCQFQIVTNFPRRIIPGCSTSEILKLEEEEEEETSATKIKLVQDDGADKKIACPNPRWMTIEEAGLKSSEMLFVQAVDETDDEEDSPNDS